MYCVVITTFQAVIGPGDLVYLGAVPSVMGEGERIFLDFLTQVTCVICLTRMIVDQNLTIFACTKVSKNT